MFACVGERELPNTRPSRFASNCRIFLYKSRTSGRFINRLASGIFGLAELEESHLILPVELEEGDDGPLDATAAICADR